MISCLHLRVPAPTSLLTDIATIPRDKWLEVFVADQLVAYRLIMPPDNSLVRHMSRDRFASHLHDWVEAMREALSGIKTDEFDISWMLAYLKQFGPHVWEIVQSLKTEDEAIYAISEWNKGWLHLRTQDQEFRKAYLKSSRLGISFNPPRPTLGQ